MIRINSVSHVWSIICTNSVIDQETNNLNLFNLIEKLTLTIPEQELQKVKESGAKGIMFPFSLEVVNRFKKNKKGETVAFDFRLKLLNPAGEALITNERRVALKKEIDNMRVRTRLGPPLPVDKSGDYSIVIEFKDVDEERYTEAEVVPLEVIIQAGPNQPQQA